MKQATLEALKEKPVGSVILGTFILPAGREEASYPIRQEIIALLRSKGGKVNCYDANGRWVGRGNGEI